MTAESTTEREIIVSRLIDAPLELVFAAFTEREHVKNWWVPAGTTIHEYDATAGGQWRYSQPGHNGAAYPFKITFVEIDRPNRLVYDFETDAENAPEPVRTTVTFVPEDEQTRVTLQLMFVSAAAREETEKYGGRQGAMAALNNLAGYLADVVVD